MIVVDTNVIAYLLIQGDRTYQAEAVLEKHSDWAAPYLWRSEFRNILALYIRQKHISLPNAKLLMQEAEDLMRGREFEVPSSRILDLAASSGCSAYDCEFVALAEQLDLDLVTSDKTILTAFPSIARSMNGYV